MDKRVAKHYPGDLRLANVQPNQRKRLFKQFPLPHAAAA